MDFNKLKERKTVSETLTLKMEIELTNSMLTPEDAAARIQYLIDSSNAKDFSSFIVFLLRETRSSMWEMKNLEIT